MVDVVRALRLKLVQSRYASLTQACEVLRLQVTPQFTGCGGFAGVELTRLGATYFLESVCGSVLPSLAN